MAAAVGFEKRARSWKLKHIPAQSTFDSNSTVDVIAAKIDCKLASTLIRKLNAIAPLPSLGHTKRIKKICTGDAVELCILLCMASNTSKSSVMNIPEEISALVEQYGLNPFKTMVSALEATTREEWEAQCQLWPTSFHPNSCSRPTLVEFMDEEEKIAAKFMELAIEQARLARTCGQPLNGAVIVEPLSGSIIATGYDQTGEPTGTYKQHCEDRTKCSVQHDDKQANSRKLDIKDSWHPLQHAVMVAINRAAERDLHLFKKAVDMSAVKQNIKQDVDENEYTNVSGSSENKRQKIEESLIAADIMATPGFGKTGDKQDLQQPYLCTGFDIYVTREPCAMCAMALVHQRIRRVFYGIENPKYGALGSRFKLHGQQGLNHHYTVIKMSLTEDDLPS